MSCTGGPSSSCEMIILRNNSHGGIIRVCMRIFTTALRNKKIRQTLNKNTSTYFHSVSLVIWPLSLMKRTHFSEFSISRFSTYIRKPRNEQLTKMGSFHQSKDNKWYVVEVRWGIFIENLTYFYIPWSGCKYSHTNSCNSRLLLRKMIISQLELGAACASRRWISPDRFKIYWFASILKQITTEIRA